MTQKDGRGGSEASHSRMPRAVQELERKYGILRAAKFGIASAAGFLVVELILTIGTFIFFRGAHVPSNDYASPTILGLNVAAFAVGITVAFFINERITVRNQGDQKASGAKSVIIRLLKFQLAYLLGNLITVGVQLLLLAEFSITPAVGNIVGAIIAYPISYLVSMRFVWKVHPLKTNPSSASGSADLKDSGYNIFSADPFNQSVKI